MGCSDVSRLWLEILSVRGVSCSRWLGLVRKFPVERIADMLRCAKGRRELERLLGRKVPAPNRRFVDEQMGFLNRGDYGIVTVSDSGYPSMLREIQDPPPLLFFLGDHGVTNLPAICIVGSRCATRRGCIYAGRLAFELSRRRFNVVSGMARGIDSAAHEGALKAEGATCAVLGNGLDIPYPPENASLAVEISSRGCVFSEFPFGTPPLKYNFPRRNRILSGLSLGVVVVEASLESGAMSTARWAAEQGREVFAVPGPIENPLSRGPHRLIREGAHLIECVEDIIAQLPPCGRVVDAVEWGDSEATWRGLTAVERRILSVLELNPKHVDELVQICDISATSALPTLLNLEMRGMVESCGGGNYALRAESLHVSDGDQDGTGGRERDLGGKAERGRSD